MNRQLKPIKYSNCAITLESLDRIFEQNKNPATFTHRGRCGICGCSVKIEITKTSGGYGLLGGMLYEPDTENYISLCVGCYEESGKLMGDYAAFS